MTINNCPNMLYVLKTVGVNLKTKEYKHLKIKSPGYMDLYIDYWPEGQNLKIDMAHNLIQNGNVMADPDMEFLLTHGELIPLTYQLDSLGIYDSSRAPKAIDSRAKFAETWARNLIAQGFILNH